MGQKISDDEDVGEVRREILGTKRRKDKVIMKKEKSQSKRQESYASLLVLGIIFLAIAMFLLYEVILTPEPKYENLIETNAVVDNFHIHRSNKTSDSAILVTTDGIEYRITGDYDDGELNDKLVAGTDVKIKYYEHTGFFFFKTNCAQELTVNNKVIASYHNHYVMDAISSGFYVILLMSISVLLLRKYIKQIVSKK